MTLALWGLLCAGIAFLASGGFLAVLIFRRIRQVRQMTSEELAEEEGRRRKEQDDMELFEAIQKEAQHLIKAIPEHLATQNKLQHVEREPGRKRRKNLVRFEAVLMTRTEIWFRFDGRRLPYGTSFTDLKNPSNGVIENLQHGINRPCRFYEDYQYNLFLRVGLKNSLMGIPKKVRWSEVVEALPRSKRYAFAVGVNEYNKLVWEDITSWPHGLIAGSTGMGKTTALKQILITLIKRNTPANLRFVIVDLKRTELRPFGELPHTLHYSDRPHQVLEQLQWLEKEMDRRYDLFTGECYDIRGWNRLNPHRRLYRILVVIDELASITTDDELGKAALKSIVNLARLGRAAGIHLLLCTQYVSRTVLPMAVLANIEGRLSFSLSNSSASTLVMGNGVAYGLSSHVGRCVYQSGANQLVLQAPYATDEEVEQILAEAMEGKGEKESDDILIAEHIDLLKIALYNYGGKANIRDIWRSAKEGGAEIGRKRVGEMLAASVYDPADEEPKVWEIDGERYILLPDVITSGGRIGRQLVVVNGHLPKSSAEIEELALSQLQSQEEEEELSRSNHNNGAQTEPGQSHEPDPIVDEQRVPHIDPHIEEELEDA